MQYFFPAFFQKISADEIIFFLNNENWVLEIFGEFLGSPLEKNG
jgi:hypothetical protein